MNADGSGKQLIYRPDNAWDLSHAMHQGHRWYLASGPSPNNLRWALFAIRDDGDPDSIVLLVEEAALPGDREMTSSRWAKDDSFISFGAIDAPNDVAEIWVAAIGFDDTTGRPALVAAPLPVVVEEPQLYIRDFDFSPLGDEVGYQLSIGGADSLLVRDLVTGATRVLSDRGENPAWSPDGAYIAFRVRDVGIHVIRPDGTGLRQLTNSTWGDYLADWSPDGKHIVFNRHLRKNGPGGFAIFSGDVMRVPVTGGSAVNLTKDIDGSAGAAFWRQ
jgi:Tol biopolymer transport system component